MGKPCSIFILFCNYLISYSRPRSVYLSLFGGCVIKFPPFYINFLSTAFHWMKGVLLLFTCYFEVMQRNLLFGILIFLSSSSYNKTVVTKLLDFILYCCKSICLKSLFLKFICFVAMSKLGKLICTITTYCYFIKNTS